MFLKIIIVIQNSARMIPKSKFLIEQSFILICQKHNFSEGD